MPFETPQRTFMILDDVEILCVGGSVVNYESWKCRRTRDHTQSRIPVDM
jgi:hypothetical protein